jgi:quinol monooxygenase YgiN
MVVLEVHLEALPDKRSELEKAVQWMVAIMKDLDGCQRAEACQHLGNPNAVLLIADWRTREALDYYLASEPFSALLGTRILLCRDPSLRLHAVNASEGADSILSVRASL